MLKELLALNEASLNISTSQNGQKNIVVMAQGSSPLVLTGKIEESHLIEQEIVDFLTSITSITGVTLSSNKQDAIAKTKEMKSTGNKKAKVTTNDATETNDANDISQLDFIQNTEAPITGNSFDDILAEFKI